MKDKNRGWFLLWHYRRWAGLEQNEAAQRAGLSESLWSIYESGKRPPARKSSTIRRFARAVATSTTPEPTKYEMLCRSLGYVDLLPRPVRAMAGLPKYLPPQYPLVPTYLEPGRDLNFSRLRLAQDLAASARKQFEAAGFTAHDLLARLDDAVAGTFHVEVRKELVDDAFAAFFFPMTNTIVVNPDLDTADSRQAVGHELAHLLFEKSFAAASEDGRQYAMDAYFGCNHFENVMGERHVNWLSALMMFPQPFSGNGFNAVSADLVEQIAAEHAVPPETVLCRLCIQMASERDIGVSPEEAATLVRRFPKIVYYW